MSVEGSKGPVKDGGRGKPLIRLGKSSFLPALHISP